jgi:hypothetical protein
MTTDGIILAGQLLGTAFACGLNLYATVALLGLAARLDLVAELPVGMSGLENGIVIGAAAGLYVIEVVVDRVPFLDHAWEAVHTLVRPAAAGLLVVLALQGLPWYVLMAAAAAAAITALAAHGTKAGLRLILSAPSIDDDGRLRARRTLARSTLSFLEDVAAVGIVIAALLHSAIAVVLFGATLLLLIVAGPRLWRAALLGLRALVARARGFFGQPGWRSREQLPRSLRAAVPVEPLGRSPARAMRAAVTGMPRVGAYRQGFLVFTCDGPRFVFRARFRSRARLLGGITAVSLRRGLLTDALEVSAEARDVTANGAARAGRHATFTFLLLKDGPPAHVAAAELLPDVP